MKLGAEELKVLDDASAWELGYPYKHLHNVQKRW